jgi:threonylcarbamoyladenosine tRNA methylthiotransferase MtaB
MCRSRTAATCCTFCIIPLAAGRRAGAGGPGGGASAQAGREPGAEIVLTGVDITTYGADLPGELTLGRLVTNFEARA